MPADPNCVFRQSSKAKSRAIKHFHIHVLPRKLGDDPKRDCDLKLGNRETIAALADKIRAYL